MSFRDLRCYFEVLARLAAHTSGPRATSLRFLVMFKKRLYSTVQSSHDVVRRSGCLHHIPTCAAFSRCCAMAVRRLTTSYEIAQPSYNPKRVQMLSSDADTHCEVARSRTDVISRPCDVVLFPYDKYTCIRLSQIRRKLICSSVTPNLRCNIVADSRTIIYI